MSFKQSAKQQKNIQQIYFVAAFLHLCFFSLFKPGFPKLFSFTTLFLFFEILRDPFPRKQLISMVQLFFNQSAPKYSVFLRTICGTVLKLCGHVKINWIVQCCDGEKSRHNVFYGCLIKCIKVSKISLNSVSQIVSQKKSNFFFKIVTNVQRKSAPQAKFV